MKKILKLLAPVLAANLVPLISWAGPVNINTADAATLARELNGIGLSKAEAIVADRKRNGLFKNAIELTRVKGIGGRIIELNKDNIRLADPSR